MIKTKGVLLCFIAFGLALIFWSGYKINTKQEPRFKINYTLNLPSNPKGLIIVFPKLGDTANDTDIQTKINELAYDKGYASLIFDYYKSFFLTEKDFQIMYNVVEQSC